MATFGSVEFGWKKALNDVPLNKLVLRARIPKARCLEVMFTDGPSNSTFFASFSTAFNALKENRRKKYYISLKFRVTITRMPNYSCRPEMILKLSPCLFVVFSRHLKEA